MESVAGGKSVIDSTGLHIPTLGAAESFISTYGYLLSSEKDEEELWQFHRRAIVLMVEKLGFPETEIPEILRDPKVLKDLRNLLLYASSSGPSQYEDGSPVTVAETQNLQRWACAILRCMHVFVHSEKDLFGSFSEEIQNQILTPFEQAVVYSGDEGAIELTSKEADEKIQLAGFQAKPFKASNSAVIKLLAKPDAVAMRVFDKLGVRFVTRTIFDSFRVIRFLARENLIAYPHIMPDQSSNNIFPVELFLKVCEDIKASGTRPDDSEIENLFLRALQDRAKEVQFIRKPNDFSGIDYQFIKFISRKLIKIDREGKEAFSFFYPYEVQILDQNSFARTVQGGDSEHEAYKERQRLGARKRLFPEDCEAMPDTQMKEAT